MNENNEMDEHQWNIYENQWTQYKPMECEEKIKAMPMLERQSVLEGYLQNNEYRPKSIEHQWKSKHVKIITKQLNIRESSKLEVDGKL